MKPEECCPDPDGVGDEPDCPAPDCPVEDSPDEGRPEDNRSGEDGPDAALMIAKT